MGLSPLRTRPFHLRRHSSSSSVPHSPTRAMHKPPLARPRPPVLAVLRILCLLAIPPAFFFAVATLVDRELAAVHTDAPAHAHAPRLDALPVGDGVAGADAARPTGADGAGGAGGAAQPAQPVPQQQQQPVQPEQPEQPPPPAQVPAQPPAEQPAEQPAEAPAEQPAEQPAEPAAEPAAQPPADHPADHPADQPADQPADPPAQPAAQPPEDPPAEPPAQPTAATAATAATALSRGARRRARLGKLQGPCMTRDAAPRAFIMVFMGHSGSSAIMSELGAHSRTLVEIPELVDHHAEASNTTLALQTARAFLARGVAAGRVPGFKMRPKHIRNDPAGWRALAREFRVAVLWNHRENLVKQAVGSYSYKKLGDDSVVEGLRSADAAAERCKHGAGCRFRVADLDFFHLTLRGLVRSADQIAEAVAALSLARYPSDPNRKADAQEAQQNQLCVLETPYEDYLYDRGGTMRDVFRFLALPVEETRPRRYKATRDNMCEVVDNWDEVCANFYGCVMWRGMMNDLANGCTCDRMGAQERFCWTGRSW